MLRKEKYKINVPETGIEPARPNGHMALNHACLPIPALGQRKDYALLVE